MKKKFVYIFANKNSSLFLICKVAAPPAVALLKLVDRRELHVSSVSLCDCWG